MTAAKRQCIMSGELGVVAIGRSLSPGLGISSPVSCFSFTLLL